MPEVKKKKSLSKVNTISSEGGKNIQFDYYIFSTQYS